MPRRQSVGSGQMIEWAELDGGRWYAVTTSGLVYIVRPAVDGRYLVGRGRLSVIPSKQLSVLDLDAARAWIEQDLVERRLR